MKITHKKPTKMEQKLTLILDKDIVSQGSFSYSFSSRLLEKLKELRASNTLFEDGGQYRLASISNAVLHHLTGQIPTGHDTPYTGEEVDKFIAVAEEFLAIFHEKNADVQSMNNQTSDERPVAVKELLLKNVDEILRFVKKSCKVRLKRLFKRLEVKSIASLLQYTKEDLSRYNTVGKKSIDEIWRFYEEYGIDHDIFNPRINAIFAEIASLKYEDVPGLTTNKDFIQLSQLTAGYPYLNEQSIMSDISEYKKKMYQVVPSENSDLIELLFDQVKYKVDLFIEGKLKELVMAM